MLAWPRSFAPINDSPSFDWLGKALLNCGPLMILADPGLDEERWPWPWMLKGTGDERVEVIDVPLTGDGSSLDLAFVEAKLSGSEIVENLVRKRHRGP